MGLANGRIVDEKDFGSSHSVIVVSEYHYKKDVQLDVFEILMELRRDISFDLLLLENFEYGPTNWSDFPYPNVEDLKELYGDLDVDLRIDEKLKRGAPMFGYMNRDKVQVWGVETERHYNKETFVAKDLRCQELSLREYYQGDLTLREHEELNSLKEFIREIVVRKASFDFVDSSLEIMDSLGKNLAVFNVGDAHRGTMVERLNQLGVSYKWVCPRSFNNYVIPIEFYLIERKS